MNRWIATFWASMAGEWRRLARTPSLLMVLLAIPTVYPLLAGALYERNQVVERPAIVVDDDNSSLSRRLVRDLDATQEIRVERRLGSLEAGWRAIRAQQADLLVYVPRDFSARVKKGEQGHVKLWINSGNMLTYGSAYGAVSSVVGQLNAELGAKPFLDKGMGREAALRRAPPVIRTDRVLFHPTGAYGAFFVPGLLLVVMQQAVLIGMAFSAGIEQENPATEPSPFPCTSLLGKAAAQLALYLSGVGLVVGVIMPAFGWGGRNTAPVLALFAAFCVAVVPIGVMVASLVRDRYAAFQVLMLVSAPVFLISGFSWPLEQMPAVIRWLASILPSTPALLALRTLSMKSGTWEAVQPYVAWMAWVSAGWMVVALVVARRSWRRAGLLVLGRKAQ